MDVRLPGRRTKSPDATWEALVAEGGALRMRPFGDDTQTVAVDADVLPEVAFSPDDRFLVYARLDPMGESDLWLVAAPWTATPIRLTDWVGTEDRPVVSPDGRAVAFVAGRTGIASLWTFILADGATTAVQLTNVGLEHVQHASGVAPEGFIPPPDKTTLRWDQDGLSWVAQKQRWTVAP
jgi:WD40-like Beta Propeller Repeat